MTEDKESSLLNIVTGQVPSKELENQLLNAQATGRKYMDEFVDDRLVKKEQGFLICSQNITENICRSEEAIQRHHKITRLIQLKLTEICSVD